MKISRREFAALSTSALAAISVPRGLGDPLRVRRNVNTLSATELDVMRAGITAMSALPVDDFRSRAYQSCVHGAPWVGRMSGAGCPGRLPTGTSVITARCLLHLASLVPALLGTDHARALRYAGVRRAVLGFRQQRIPARCRARAGRRYQLALQRHAPGRAQRWHRSGNRPQSERDGHDQFPGFQLEFRWHRIESPQSGAQPGGRQYG